MSRARRILDRQTEKLLREERRLLDQPEGGGLLGPAREKLAEKTPEKLEAALRCAFEKGLRLILEQGTPVLTKTFDARGARAAFAGADAQLRVCVSRRGFARIDRTAKGHAARGEGFSTVEGAVLGLLGIGLPDIPLLIAVLLRTVYRVAQSYGYGFEGEGERVFLLHIVCAAASRGERRASHSAAADRAGFALDAGDAPAGDCAALLREAAGRLADAMLIPKMVQGFPVVGAVGSVTNNRLVHAVGNLARIKYKKRYLRAVRRREAGR